MNNPLKRSLGLLLALLIVASLFGCQTPQPKLLPDNLQKHSYRMDLTLDESKQTVTGHLEVTYRNSTGVILKEIPFSVYPNAYLSVKTAPFSTDDMTRAYPNGFVSGGLTIERLLVDGSDADYTLGNEDKTLVTVKLPGELAPNGSAVVAFDFTVTLPNSLGRFGYGEKAFNLCNFYPIACAYDGSKFLSYPYVKRGDPFVSDVADYQVTLKVPTGMTAAHSGTSAVSTKDGFDVYAIDAPDVRDFAAVVSRHFVVKSQQVNFKGTDTTVKSYSYDDNTYGTAESLVSGVNAVKAFSELIGPYPYKQLSIVQTDFFIGGMEYPNLVLIDQTLYDKDSAEFLEFVVAHEAGHQWFYGVVGNDQVIDPWMDEALTEYITICYYGYRYSAAEQKAKYEQFEKLNYLYYKMNDMIPDDQDHIGLPSTSFDDDYTYSIVVYSHGVMMLDSLAQKVGQAKLLKALSVYYRTYAGKRTTKKQLFEVLDRETGYDCTKFLGEWL